ncbi:MAG TPA: 50S ribosomal protein L21 [Candidatus Acidoferrales bacterium]|jgi:large subunit ribosomal protein L21|nr:50S ribosomal protein L21 [Candidatus Acidoferrales bacterium]
MYAVIETGGKQYRVEVGTELEVELLDVAAGETMTFERVLLVADGETAAIGRPVVENASVAATILGRDRGPKLISFKYRPKARRRVKKGHRQELTLLRISDIVLDGHSAAADVAKADEARKRDRAKLEEAAKRQAAADAELAAKLAAEAEKAAPAKPAKAGKATETKAAKATETKAAKADAPKAKGAAKATPAKAAPAKAAKPAAKAAKPAAKTTKKKGS